MTDSVNHPSHYTFGTIEVIDVIEDWGLCWHLGNAVKYIARAGRKDPAKFDQDLRKAVWVIERKIKAGEFELERTQNRHMRDLQEAEEMLCWRCEVSDVSRTADGDEVLLQQEVSRRANEEDA
jgi:hypothetical protein